MRERRVLRGLPIAGVAAAGVVLGHWLTYDVAVPDPSYRARILLDSGHSYWLTAVKLAVVLGLSALGAVALRHFRAPTDPEERRDRGLVYTRLVMHLTFLQVCAFTGMEVVERLAAHAPVGQMVSHHMFFLGLAVQFLVATLGAFVLLGFSRAAARMAWALLRPPRQASRPATSRPPLVQARQIRLLAGGFGLRGPPSR